MPRSWRTAASLAAQSPAETATAAIGGKHRHDQILGPIRAGAQDIRRWRTRHERSARPRLARWSQLRHRIPHRWRSRYRRTLAVPAGDYTLFVNVKDPNNWTLIVSKATGEWGLAYNAAQDLGQVKMTMSKPPALVEVLKYTITSTGGKKGKIELAWENHVASVPVAVK